MDGPRRKRARKCVKTTMDDNVWENANERERVVCLGMQSFPPTVHSALAVMDLAKCTRALREASHQWFRSIGIDGLWALWNAMFENGWTEGKCFSDDESLLKQCAEHGQWVPFRFTLQAKIGTRCHTCFKHSQIPVDGYTSGWIKWLEIHSEDAWKCWGCTIANLEEFTPDVAFSNEKEAAIPCLKFDSPFSPPFLTIFAKKAHMKEYKAEYDAFIEDMENDLTGAQKENRRLLLECKNIFGGSERTLTLGQQTMAAWYCDNRTNLDPYTKMRITSKELHRMVNIDLFRMNF